MKRILLIAMVVCLSMYSSFAQLPNGSLAPDWTLTDLNGTTHNLYSYLDSGYTVFIDFSAVWCGPCWSYHISGALENLYIDHGPAGYPNVSPATTNDVMVFFIEGDANTVANLGGSGGGTQGDWITGTPYPIICTDGTVNNAAVTSSYSIGYWPTIYRICPDRVLIESGQSSNPYSFVSSCPPPTTNINDVKAMAYEGVTETCSGSLSPELKVQNYGLTTLTSFDIEVLVNGVQNSVTPWTGNLATYQLTTIPLPAINGITGTSQIEIKTTNPNGGADDDMSNNDVSFTATLAYQAAHVNVTIAITTDQYGSETTWDIKTSSGVAIASGGPYADGSVSIQTPVTTTLLQDQCYTFTIYDAYGDGICCNYGQGSYSVTDGNAYSLASGGQFTDEESVQFKTNISAPQSWDCISPGNCQDPGTGNGQYNSYVQCLTACFSTDIDENISERDFILFPNPANDIATLSFTTTETSKTIVTITNILGEIIYSNEIGSLNVGQHIMPISTYEITEGIYFINLITNNKIITKKITIVR